MYAAEIARWRRRVCSVMTATDEIWWWWRRMAMVAVHRWWWGNMTHAMPMRMVGHHSHWRRPIIHMDNYVVVVVDRFSRFP